MRHFLLTVLSVIVLVSIQAFALPKAVTKLYPNMEKVGSSVYYYFVVKVYSIDYFQSEENEALHLTYHRDVKAKRRLEAVMKDLPNQGTFDGEILSAWEAQMAEIFPDVKKGDSITVTRDAAGNTKFFHNGKLRGEIADPEYTEAFFGIWLGENAADEDMKLDLLGDDDGSLSYGNPQD